MPGPGNVLTAAVLLPLLALSACDDKKSDRSGTKPGNVAKTADAGRSPCSLVTADEVAAVIGPLAGPPYRGRAGVPNPAADSCRYETPELRSVAVNVEWKGGAQTLQIMGMVQGMLKESVAGQLKLIDGTTLAGGWSDARITGCCEFHALSGDRLVSVDVAGSHATIQQAAALADAALKRLGQPLSVDDAAAIDAARVRAALRPQPRPVCTLLSRAEVEAIIKTRLQADPVGTLEKCTYNLPLYGPGSETGITMAVDWVNGFHEMRVTQASIGSATAAMGMGMPAGPKATAESASEVAQSIIGVAAVRNDVLISVESGPVGQDVIRALVVKALDNAVATPAKH